MYTYCRNTYQQGSKLLQTLNFENKELYVNRKNCSDKIPYVDYMVFLKIYSVHRIQLNNTF